MINHMSFDELRSTVEYELMEAVKGYFRFRLTCSSQEVKDLWAIGFVDWLRELVIDDRRYVASRPCFDDEIVELNVEDEDDKTLIIQYTAI